MVAEGFPMLNLPQGKESYYHAFQYLSEHVCIFDFVFPITESHLRVSSQTVFVITVLISLLLYDCDQPFETDIVHSAFKHNLDVLVFLIEVERRVIEAYLRRKFLIRELFLEDLVQVNGIMENYFF